MWRAYVGLVKKEFIQILRDRVMLYIIIAMPLIQLVLLGYAVNVDVSKIALDVYDYDRTTESRRLAAGMRAGEYFLTDDSRPPLISQPLAQLSRRFQSSDAEMALIIPNGFAAELASGGEATVALVADGTDAASARAGLGYSYQIVSQYLSRRSERISPIELRFQHLFNPELESVYYMVPGIVATLLTMITVLLTSMAVVREREVGTLEQIMVTPISSLTFLAGKLTTLAVIGVFDAALTLTMGVLWFGIPFAGSPLLLLALTSLYLLTTLGVGLFFSTVTTTQQQAMFFAWFFTIFAILTSGFFTPIANMPEAIQYITYLNPMRYFMFIVRGILMKGSHLSDLLPNVYPLIILGVTIFTLAVMRFRKRVA
jgi:ABC-2 type transport system permease protein